MGKGEDVSTVCLEGGFVPRKEHRRGTLLLQTRCCLSPTEQSITIVRGLQDVTVMEPAPAWFECETSIPSVRPPKWLLGKTALQAGKDVGIEQEGTVHRLALRRTCSTMTGPVHFTIGKSRTTAQLVVSGGRAAQPPGHRRGP